LRGASVRFPGDPACLSLGAVNRDRIRTTLRDLAGLRRPQPGLLERDGRIAAKPHIATLSVHCQATEPDLGAGGLHLQQQAAAVRDAIGPLALLQRIDGLHVEGVCDSARQAASEGPDRRNRIVRPPDRPHIVVAPA
jgi:hypothetical protein